jgi:hypothetical protein
MKLFRSNQRKNYYAQPVLLWQFVKAFMYDFFDFRNQMPETSSQSV